LNSTATKSTTTLPPATVYLKTIPSGGPYLSSKELAVLYGSYVIGLCSTAVTCEDFEDRELFLKEAQFELLNMEENNLKPDIATMNAFIQGKG
jgi:hypothetical protein